MKNFLELILIIMIVMIVSISVRGDFDTSDVGARARGLSGSYVGIADDVYGVVTNPGVIGNLRQREIGSSYRKLYIGLDDLSDISESYFGYVEPIRGAAKWIKRLLPEISDWGSVGIGYMSLNAGGLYSESTIMLSYGKTLEDVIGKEIYGGMNIKVLTNKYGSNAYTENAIDFLGNTYGRDPVFAGGYGKSEIGIDVGGYYKLSDKYSIGMSIINMNRPNTGLKHVSLLPVEIKGGMSYMDEDSNIVVDMKYKDGDIVISPGMEKWLMLGEIGLRGGFEIGSRDLAGIGLGLSYKYKRMMRIDYSFEMPLKGIKETSGTHGISVLVYIGTEEKRVEEEMPQGYRGAQKEYEEGRYYRAYDKFSEIVSTGTTGKYLRNANEYIDKIKADMEGIVSEKQEGNEVRYAMGMLMYMSKKYEDAMKEIEGYGMSGKGEEEIREYKRKIKGLIEEEKRSKVDKGIMEGRALYGQKEYSRAIRKLEEVKSIEAKNGEASKLIIEIRKKVEEEKKSRLNDYYTKGLMFYTDKKYGRAMVEWEKCLKIDGEFKEAREYIERAKEEINKQKETQDREKQNKQVEEAPAVVIDKMKAEEYYNKALIKYNSGNLEGAIKDLEESIKNNPDHKSAQEALGRIKREYEKENSPAK